MSEWTYVRSQLTKEPVMPTAVSKRSRRHPSVFGVLTVSFLVAFVLLIIIVAVFGMDGMMDVVHSMMVRIGM